MYGVHLYTHSWSDCLSALRLHKTRKNPSCTCWMGHKLTQTLELFDSFIYYFYGSIAHRRWTMALHLAIIRLLWFDSTISNGITYERCLARFVNPFNIFIITWISECQNRYFPKYSIQFLDQHSKLRTQNLNLNWNLRRITMWKSCSPCMISRVIQITSIIKLTSLRSMKPSISARNKQVSLSVSCVFNVW